MKRNIIKYPVFLMMVCALLITQTHTYAQDKVTQAKVEFKAGEGPTSPVNPDNPEEESNEDSVAGSLAIVSVSHFDFGVIPITYNAIWHSVKTVKPNIQVVDLRGTAAGWKVSAKMSPFTDGEKESLKGASIFIIDGRPNSLSAPPGPVPNKDAELTADNATVPIMTAPKDAGIGLWIMRWYAGALDGGGVYVHLEVPPGSAALGNHSANIDWTLANAPV